MFSFIWKRFLGKRVKNWLYCLLGLALLSPLAALEEVRQLFGVLPGGAKVAQVQKEIQPLKEVVARTVARVRRDFAQGGLERATTRKTPARVYRHRLDGAAEAKLVELACGPAPAGQQRWSVQLLRDELIRLDLVEHVAVSTVHRTLKKTNCSPGASRSGALPS